MFRDRNDAAERLATRLQKYRARPDALILAIPRGGISIGAVLARKLRLPLDIALAKKIGHPKNSERAIGAVSLKSDYADLGRLADEGVSSEYLEDEIARIREELKHRYELYRGAAKAANLADKTVILVDDGVATGATLLAAAALVKRENPARLIVAVPVATRKAATLLSAQVDEVICLESPEKIETIGRCYRVFGRLSDEEAARLLVEANSKVGA